MTFTEQELRSSWWIHAIMMMCYYATGVFFKRDPELDAELERLVVTTWLNVQPGDPRIRTADWVSTLNGETYIRWN